MIVKLYSQLGNQMFMYALGEGLRAAGKNVSYYFQDDFVGYDLAPFVKLDLLTKDEIKGQHKYTEKTFRYDPQVFVQPDNTVFEGCWQTEKYFSHIAPQIRSDFTLKNVSPELEAKAKQLRSCNSVAVGVRRGENLLPEKQAYHGLMTLDYYNKAYKLFPHSQFFIFSDDPDWCEQNMTGTVMRSNKYEDLYLFSQCRNAIIGNSTFHWWGAWLGNGKVVAPARWFNKAPLDYRDVVPESWVKL